MGWFEDISTYLTGKLNPIIGKVNNLTGANFTLIGNNTGAGTRSKWYQVFEVSLANQYNSCAYHFSILGRNMSIFTLTLELERGAPGFSVKRMYLHSFDISVGYEFDVRLVTDEDNGVARIYLQGSGSDWNAIVFKCLHKHLNGTIAESFDQVEFSALSYPSTYSEVIRNSKTAVRQLWHSDNYAAPSMAADANKVAQRDSNGDLAVRYLKTSQSAESTIPLGSDFFYRDGSTGLVKPVTKAGLLNYLELQTIELKHDGQSLGNITSIELDSGGNMVLKASAGSKQISQLNIN